MRDLAEIARKNGGINEYNHDEGGIYHMRSKSAPGVVLRIIASNGQGWDHVSVSTPDRCPTWDEMEQVKRFFFEDWETAVQFHVPPSEHVNYHPFCLHLFRSQRTTISRPPAHLVGPQA